MTESAGSSTGPDPGPGAGHRTLLGITIRVLRRAHGSTLRELAEEIGVSAATLSGIENGRTGVSSQRLEHLAVALRVSVERLLDHTAPDPQQVAVAPPVWTGDDWRAYPPLHLDTALAGALSSFLEFGYHGASMRTIAERAGLSVPGLYHYYAGKQQMLVALLDLTMADLRARSEAALADADGPVQRLALIVECLALYHTHRRELGFVGASEMRSLEPTDRARVAALRIAEQRMVDAAVEDGVWAGVFTTPRPHAAARAVVTMCTALSSWFDPDGPESAEQVALQYVDFALDLVGRR